MASIELFSSFFYCLIVAPDLDLPVPASVGVTAVEADVPVPTVSVRQILELVGGLELPHDLLCSHKDPKQVLVCDAAFVLEPGEVFVAERQQLILADRGIVVRGHDANFHDSLLLAYRLTFRLNRQAGLTGCQWGGENYKNSAAHQRSMRAWMGGAPCYTDFGSGCLGAPALAGCLAGRPLVCPGNGNTRSHI